MNETNYYIGVAENVQAYLAHYGIPGMKRGYRRYTNPDGSLTDEGYLRYYGHGRGMRSRRANAQSMTRKEQGAVKNKNAKRRKVAMIAAGSAFAVGAAGVTLYSIAKKQRAQRANALGKEYAANLMKDLKRLTTVSEYAKTLSDEDRKWFVPNHEYAYDMSQLPGNRGYFEGR